MGISPSAHWSDIIVTEIDACRRVHAGRFVRLRPLEIADAACTLEWRLGKRAALLNDGAQTVEEQANWIGVHRANELNFLIEILPAGTPVGMVSLVDIDIASKSAEPARFLIGEPELCQSLPVAVEALKLLYEVAFQHLGVEELNGSILERNRQMRKWHKYMGMVETGVLPRTARIKGREESLIGVILTRSDYDKTALPSMNRLVALGATMSAEKVGTQ